MDSLIVFVKQPQLAKVKTRIAKTVGDKKALEIYLQLLHHTAQLLKALDQKIAIFYAPTIPDNDKIFNDIDCSKHEQKGHDLGEKMNHAFETVLQNASKCIIIGSDCLEINASIIQNAFDALDENDFCLGPTIDGGYYLLGMKKSNAEIFENIDWSTDQVFDQTLKKMKKDHSTVAIMPRLSDIDHYEDWIKYKHLCQS